MKKLLSLIVLAVIGADVACGHDAMPQDAEWRTYWDEVREAQSRADSIIKTLRRTDAAQWETIRRMKGTATAQAAEMDSLRNVIERLSTAQTEMRAAFTGEVDTIKTEMGNTRAQVRSNAIQLSDRTLWGCVIGALLLLGLAAVAAWLSRRIRSGSTTIDEVRRAQEAMQAAQAKMQEESLRLDNKLLELLEKQMPTATQVPEGAAVDHSLVKKVADEIVRIEVNLSRMDPAIKGHKQLSKAVERLRDNFRANGYEIVEMLGKPYKEGMKAVASFVTDETLAEGERIITKVIKPQINYQGQMIQAAQIEVSQAE